MIYGQLNRIVRTPKQVKCTGCGNNVLNGENVFLPRYSGILCLYCLPYQNEFLFRTSSAFKLAYSNALTNGLNARTKP